MGMSPAGHTSSRRRASARFSQLGIARSGLYVVVAVLRDGRTAGRTLQRLIAHTSFGDTPIRAFVDAVRQRAVDTA